MASLFTGTEVISMPTLAKPVPMEEYILYYHVTFENFSLRF
jgi:hypothetical protein